MQSDWPRIGARRVAVRIGNPEQVRTEAERLHGLRIYAPAALGLDGIGATVRLIKREHSLIRGWIRAAAVPIAAV